MRSVPMPPAEVEAAIVLPDLITMCTAKLHAALTTASGQPTVLQLGSV